MGHRTIEAKALADGGRDACVVERVSVRAALCHSSRVVVRGAAGRLWDARWGLVNVVGCDGIHGLPPDNQPLLSELNSPCSALDSRRLQMTATRRLSTLLIVVGVWRGVTLNGSSER